MYNALKPFFGLKMGLRVVGEQYPYVGVLRPVGPHNATSSDVVEVLISNCETSAFVSVDHISSFWKA